MIFGKRLNMAQRISKKYRELGGLSPEETEAIKDNEARTKQRLLNYDLGKYGYAKVKTAILDDERKK